MREKHGQAFESASDRSTRKKAEKQVKNSPSAQDMKSAAEWVGKTPESAKRRASHRATASDPKDNGRVRSTTAWWRS